VTNVSSDSNAGDDFLLLRAWHEGDRSAGQALIRRYHEPVTRFFRTKAFEHAQDLAQRTFLGLAEARDRFSGESSVRAFLFGIARNVLFEFYRSKKRHGAEAPDFAAESLVDLAPGVSTQAAERSEMRVLLQALQRIPADLQSLLELHYWEGLSVDELAAAFQIAPGTVKSRMHRARGLLQQEIGRVSASPSLLESTQTVYAAWLERAAGRADAR
jgi:RNA polymerase sigma-70 factor (ECF subfamily)